MRFPRHLKRVVLLAMATTTLALASCTRDDKAGTQPTTATPAVAAPVTVAPDKAVVEARMRECRAALEAAIAPGLLTNASFDNGRPILWVGPAWKGTTPAIRHALARDAACFFRSGDESQPIRYSVYDNASDREIAVWDYTHLLIL